MTHRSEFVEASRAWSGFGHRSTGDMSRLHGRVPGREKDGDKGDKSDDVKGFEKDHLQISFLLQAFRVGLGPLACGGDRRGRRGSGCGNRFFLITKAPLQSGKSALAAGCHLNDVDSLSTGHFLVQASMQSVLMAKKSGRVGNRRTVNAVKERKPR